MEITQLLGLLVTLGVGLLLGWSYARDRADIEARCKYTPPPALSRVQKDLVEFYRRFPFEDVVLMLVNARGQLKHHQMEHDADRVNLPIYKTFYEEVTAAMSAKRRLEELNKDYDFYAEVDKSVHKVQIRTVVPSFALKEGAPIYKEEDSGK